MSNPEEQIKMLEGFERTQYIQHQKEVAEAKKKNPPKSFVIAKIKVFDQGILTKFTEKHIKSMELYDPKTKKIWKLDEKMMDTDGKRS